MERKGVILIIDDEKRIRDLLGEVIEMLTGHKVITAENGEKGLKLAQQKDPAIIFTDIDMPGISGLQVIINLRAYEQFRDTRIYAMSGNPAYKRKVEKIGADGFLEKPFDLNSIKNIVERVLGK